MGTHGFGATPRVWSTQFFRENTSKTDSILDVFEFAWSIKVVNEFFVGWCSLYT